MNLAISTGYSIATTAETALARGQRQKADLSSSNSGSLDLRNHFNITNFDRLREAKGPEFVYLGCDHKFENSGKYLEAAISSIAQTVGTDDGSKRPLVLLIEGLIKQPIKGTPFYHINSQGHVLFNGLGHNSVFFFKVRGRQEDGDGYIPKGNSQIRVVVQPVLTNVLDIMKIMRLPPQVFFSGWDKQDSFERGLEALLSKEISKNRISNQSSDEEICRYYRRCQLLKACGLRSNMQMISMLSSVDKAFSGKPYTVVGHMGIRHHFDDHRLRRRFPITLEPRAAQQALKADDKNKEKYSAIQDLCEFDPREASARFCIESYVRRFFPDLVPTYKKEEL